jgi:periplasmic divalent cation tolerance protein
MTACFVYITVPDADGARRIARALVERRLAACANIIDGMRSVYRWEGAIEEDSETVLIAKTREELVPALTDAVRSLHVHDVPCVVALRTAGGDADFLDWIEAETAPGA